MNATIDARTGLEILTRAECLRLLGHHNLGRLGVVVADQPLIFPVNYALDDASIVIRVDAGTKLHGAVGHRVAFEIDGLDVIDHGGWSVLVVGTAVTVDAPEEQAHLQTLPLLPYGPGSKAIWVRLTIDAVTGRRIVRP